MNAQLGPNASKLLGLPIQGGVWLASVTCRPYEGKSRWLVVQAFHTRSVSDGLALY